MSLQVTYANDVAYFLNRWWREIGLAAECPYPVRIRMGRMGEIVGGGGPERAPAIHTLEPCAVFGVEIGYLITLVSTRSVFATLTLRMHQTRRGGVCGGLGFTNIRVRRRLARFRSCAMESNRRNIKGLESSLKWEMD